MIENEPTQNPSPPPNWRKSIVRVLTVLLGVLLILLALSTVPGSTLHLPLLPYRWIVLTIIAVIVLIGWRPRAQKPPSPPKPSPKRTGPRARPICGVISLACAGAGVSCVIAAYIAGNFTHSGLPFAFLGWSLLLILPTLGLALCSFLRGEQPAWPAMAGAVLGPLPVVILMSVGIYEKYLQPTVQRLQHAQAHDSPSQTASANSPSTTATPPVAAGKRISPGGRAQVCAEAQAAVESWLRADTNNLFTPKYGKFVSLKGSGYEWGATWNIQGYGYVTLHRTGNFADGTIPVTIYVTEGAVTAPGQTTLGTPVLEGPVTSAQGARIFISHPRVGKGVKGQAKPETNAVRQSQTALPGLDDKIKRQQFDQAAQRWGDEGMTAVETFLKTGTNEINSVCGDFVCFEDDGTAHYQFFTAKEVSRFGGHSHLAVYNARALFSGGYILLNIYITEGRALSPRLVGIGAPTIQGRLNLHTTTALVVPHPELCSLEDFQGQDSLTYLVTDGETKLVGKYKLRSSHNASNEPCTLELRADHSLIVSNCPTPGDPQRRVAIPGEWSLSAYRGMGILFQLSVSGGGDVKLRSATCNLHYPPSPSGFYPMIHLTLQSASGAMQDLEFVAEKALPSPHMPRPNPHFVRRKPTGNPPNWHKPLFSSP